MAIDPYEVRQAITARAEALVVSDLYRRDTADGWRESSVPLVPEIEPEQLAHLGLWVDDRNQDTAGLPSGYTADFVDGAYLSAPITVRFCFQLQPHARKEGWDAAGKAGTHLLRHLLAWDNSEVNLIPDTNLIARGFLQSAPDWVAVELRLRALYTLSLAIGV